MSEAGKRQRRKLVSAQKKKQQQAVREKVIGNAASIRAELSSARSDQRGTSPGKMGEVKMQSEEARHVTCSECGFSAGRHSRFCSRKPA